MISPEKRQEIEKKYDFLITGSYCEEIQSNHMNLNEKIFHQFFYL